MKEVASLEILWDVYDPEFQMDQMDYICTKINAEMEFDYLEPYTSITEIEEEITVDSVATLSVKKTYKIGVKEKDKKDFIGFYLTTTLYYVKATNELVKDASSSSSVVKIIYGDTLGNIYETTSSGTVVDQKSDLYVSSVFYFPYFITPNKICVFNLSSSNSNRGWLSFLGNILFTSKDNQAIRISGFLGSEYTRWGNDDSRHYPLYINFNYNNEKEILTSKPYKRLEGRSTNRYGEALLFYSYCNMPVELIPLALSEKIGYTTDVYFSFVGDYSNETEIVKIDNLYYLKLGLLWPNFKIYVLIGGELK